MDTDVLRLRGGGDSESDANSDEKNCGAMDVETSGSSDTTNGSRRGPPSPGVNIETKKAMTLRNELAKSVNLHLGWLKQMTLSERSKKLTVGAAEGIIERSKALREIYTDGLLENSSLRGKFQVTQEQLKSILDTFSKSINEKAAK